MSFENLYPPKQISGYAPHVNTRFNKRFCRVIVWWSWRQSDGQCNMRPGNYCLCNCFCCWRTTIASKHWRLRYQHPYV